MKEGMVLIQEILDIFPDWAPGIQWKGIGMYKIGHFEESLELLIRAQELINTTKYDIHHYMQQAETALARQNNEM